jgi:peroxiredoxin
MAITRSTRRSMVETVVWLMFAATASGQGQPAAPAHASHVHTDLFAGSPRTKPVRLQGIGRAHLSITAAHADVQTWFDQGLTLLHSYSYFEAQRAFRLALTLDPDCAMCYWGMAQATGGARRIALIQEADKRAPRVTAHERMYIDAWARRWIAAGDDSQAARDETFQRALERLCITYPDDIEAKAFLANERLASKDKLAIDALLQQVLAVDPNHPGALHYRIHLWDHREPELVLATARRYGTIATDVGHSQHMVGHIYSSLGLWDDAAQTMDAANRTELKYLDRNRLLPSTDWNYVHNRDYLSYLQEQLGMCSAAIEGGRELLAIPLDESYNKATNPNSARWEGLQSLSRTLIRCERWQTVLDGTSLPWGAGLRDRLHRSHAEALAFLGSKNLAGAEAAVARHDALQAERDTPAFKDLIDLHAVQSAELHGRLLIAQGKPREGLDILEAAATRDLEFRRTGEALNRANVLYNVVGEAYLSTHEYDRAAEAFKKTLGVIPHDGFALSGLVEALYGMDRRTDASATLGMLEAVWAGADHDVTWLRRARSHQLAAAPAADGAVSATRYRPGALADVGPDRWSPPVVALADLRKKMSVTARERGNSPARILLLLLPTVVCPGCDTVAREFNERHAEFAASRTSIVLVSGETQEALDRWRRSVGLQFDVVSDEQSTMSRRFGAYDEFTDASIPAMVITDPEGHLLWWQTGAERRLVAEAVLRQLESLGGAAIHESQASTAQRP